MNSELEKSRQNATVTINLKTSGKTRAEFARTRSNSKPETGEIELFKKIFRENEVDYFFSKFCQITTAMSAIKIDDYQNQVNLMILKSITFYSQGILW